MRTNIVLIDLENVQPESLEALAQDHFRVLVFVGTTQSKLSFKLVDAMHRMGERAEYVRISGTGKNALDFHIAFKIGELSAKDPNACFQIISKDTGFDPLIKYLRSRNIQASRAASVPSVPRAKASNGGNSEDRARLLVEKLRLPKATKPRTEKTLSSHIAAFFNKQLTEQEVAAVVKAMRRAGWISIEDTRVVYSLG